MLQERSEVGGGGEDDLSESLSADLLDDVIDNSASFVDDELVLLQEQEAGGGGTSPSLSLTGDNKVALVSAQEYSFSSSYSSNDALFERMVLV